MATIEPLEPLKKTPFGTIQSPEDTRSDSHTMPVEAGFKGAREGVEADPRSRYDISAMSGKHRRLMRELCAGLTLKAASVAVNLSAHRAREIVKSPLFQREMARMQTDIDKLFAKEMAENPVLKAQGRLEETSIAAADALIDGLDSPDQKERRFTAVEILNRVGLKEKKDVANTLKVEVDIGIKNIFAEFGKNNVDGEVRGDADFQE